MSAPNIPWTGVTFSYLPIGGGAAITAAISAPDFGNKDNLTANQDYQHSRGGQAYVYQHGAQVRSFVLRWPNLDATERIAVDRLFAATQYALRWFTASWAPTNPEPLACGASIAGTAAAVGAGYTCGQRIIQDAVSYIVRLASPDIDWAESSWDGYWDLTLTLEVLNFLPANV